MAKNIEININNGSSYEVLYPKTLGSLVDGKVSSSGNSDIATKLETSRSIRTNLASTSVANFDGTGNITPGVNGVLGVGNGGTGVADYYSLAEIISQYLDSGWTIKKYTWTGTQTGSSATADYIVYDTVSGKTLKFGFGTVLNFPTNQNDYASGGNQAGADRFSRGYWTTGVWYDLTDSEYTQMTASNKSVGSTQSIQIKNKNVNGSYRPVIILNSAWSTLGVNGILYLIWV